MALDWSIDSGWEILTIISLVIGIISLVVGIVLAIFKIYDIVTNKQREKKSNRPKEPKIQFVNIELYSNYSKFYALRLDIRNMGDFKTTVYLKKITLTAKQEILRDLVKSIQRFKKIEIGAKGTKKFESKQIFLNMFGSPKKCSVKFHYSYLDSNGNKIEATSKTLAVTLTVPKVSSY
ncbi:MAG: hypothetical protein ACTSPM_06410 [Candidatus Heimdallarchaeota archaeon]